VSSQIRGYVNADYSELGNTQAAANRPFYQLTGSSTGNVPGADEN
jgi:hypothetical protein